MSLRVHVCVCVCERERERERERVRVSESCSESGIETVSVRHGREREYGFETVSLV